MRSLGTEYHAIEQKLSNLSDDLPLLESSVAECSRDLEYSLGRMAGFEADVLPSVRRAVRQSVRMNQLLEEIDDPCLLRCSTC